MPSPTQHTTTTPQRDQSAQTSSPWMQHPVAWTNGQTVFSSLQPVSVRCRLPRTKFIVLGVNPKNILH